tara:strand:+ start:1671 stop:2546 length:876 start_codon:yes stop_codon:yes gene_type:complete
MSEQQTDNLLADDDQKQEAPVVDDSLAEDFFAQLDRQVMGDSLKPETQEQTTSQVENPVVSHVAEETVESDNTDNVATLEKRYSDSSREAKRLNNRLTEVEPYLPILDAMREDPNLVSHVRGYFEGGGTAPVSMKEKLGLDEDFVFDYDDAISTPNSDSAQLFNATIDGVVQKRLGEFAQNQTAKTRRLNEQSAFRTKHDMQDAEYDDLLDYAKSHKLSMEDIYYLKNRTDTNRRVAEQAKTEVVEQMRNVRSMPQSVAAAGNSQPIQQSDDDLVFDALLKEGAGLDALMK